MFQDEVDIHFEPGCQVAYAPLNEVKELRNRLVEYGFVTSTHINDSDQRLTVFCRFWNTSLTELHTKGNSQGCDWYDLLHCTAVDQRMVADAWRTYVSPDIIPAGLGWVDATGATQPPAVGSLATVVYTDNLYPAIVANVKLESKVSKSHGKLCRVPVSIDVVELPTRDLAPRNLRAGLDLPPLFNMLLTPAEAVAVLPKRKRVIKHATFDAKARLWRISDGAALAFGQAQYKYDCQR